VVEKKHFRNETGEDRSARLDACNRISTAVSIIEAVWLAAPEACEGDNSRDAIMTTCAAAQDELRTAFKLLSGEVL
jgi:hypothetical protein